MTRPLARAGPTTAGSASRQLSLLADLLSEQDRTVLRLARDHHLQRPVDDRVLRPAGLTVTRYYQLLTSLLDRPEAFAVEPALLTELRALRGRRRGRRSAGAAAAGPA